MSGCSFAPFFVKWLTRYIERFSVEKTVTLKEEIDHELLTSMREGVPMDNGGVPKRQAQVNDAIPKVAPKWLKHDRQVSWIQMIVS